MKVLLDHTLSPRLVSRLAGVFDEVEHVLFAGLERAADEGVWEYARQRDLIILSKDSDFSELSIWRGFPPKVIWLQIGNCTTAQVETVLRARLAAITAFGADPETGVLILR